MKTGSRSGTINQEDKMDFVVGLVLGMALVGFWYVIHNMMWEG